MVQYHRFDNNIYLLILGRFYLFDHLFLIHKYRLIFFLLVNP